MSFREFLASLRPLLSQSQSTASRLRPLHFVFGNEAADLDSIASATAYAYLLHKLRGETAFPVVSIARAELELRTEVAALFKRLQLDHTQLLFMDDHEIFAVKSSGTAPLFVSLVDHNKPSETWQQWLNATGATVSGILDHHADEGLYSSASPRIVSMVGSASTLIARSFKENQASSDTKTVDADIAALLLSAIVLDTVHFDASAGRATTEDTQMAMWLLREASSAFEMALPFSSSSADYLRDATAELYRFLHHAKFDISHLSGRALLCKDHKVTTIMQQQPDQRPSSDNEKGFAVGMSTVLLPFSTWLNRDGASMVVDALRAHCNASRLQASVIMTAYSSGNDIFQRELILFVPSTSSSSLTLRLIAHFESHLSERLQLEQHECLEAMKSAILDDEHVRVWRQLNASISRKQLLPLLASA